MADKKKSVIPGHVWMKNTKGFEMQLPKADAVQLTHGKKGFVFLYPEDDPRRKGNDAN